MYTPKSVFKPTSRSPRAPMAKKPNVTLLFADDLETSPVRDGNGVKMVGNWTIKPGGRQPIQIYMTPSTQVATLESDGDEDATSITQKYEGVFPGDELAINELLQNTIGQNLILIYGSCQSKAKRVYGTPCAPLQVNPAFTADNDSTGHTLTFEQKQKSNLYPGWYEGALPTEAVYDVTGYSITAKEANGFVYQLEPCTVASTTIDFASVDLPAGSFVTIKGGGGSDPAVLSAGAGTGATVILKDGVDWSALDGASIDLEVVDGGTTIYLIERSRS